jgi:tetratricopeptide (TPR) repeat protein
VSSRGTNNLEAYLGFLKGLKYFWHANKDDNIMARQIFEEVIALDPNYPAAYSLLAATHLLDVYFGSTRSPRESIGRVVELSQKALVLDNCQDTAFRLMSMVYMFKRQYEKANTEAERAVACAPNSSLAYSTLGRVRCEMGKYEESIPIIKKATRLNPYPPHYVFDNLGRAYFLAGRYKEAVSALKKAVQIEPKAVLSHALLAAAYSLSDLMEEARSEAAEVIRIQPDFSVERWAKTRPIKIQADQKREIDGMRKAGLK